MPPGDFLKCVQMCKLRRAHLLPPTPAQVLLAGQRADGADPRLGHAFDPQHHPAELLALRHHAVELLEAGPDLRLHTGHSRYDTIQLVYVRYCTTEQYVPSTVILDHSFQSCTTL